MHTYVFEGVVTAMSSISHIGEAQGINARLRREKILQTDGTVEEIPVISGNALRGILRDRGMLHMLGQLGYGVDDGGLVKGLSLAAFYFLFSGGALTSTGKRGLDVDEARRWRGLIPLVSVFGGAMGNQIMPGKVKIGKLIPICLETLHLIPARFQRECGSIWDVCQMEAYTRRDDEKNEGLRELIAPDVRHELEASALSQRDKARHGDNALETTGQKQQMRYYVETLAAGTQFFWDIALDDVTSVEFEAFCAALIEFSRLPYIGGKSAVGHGRIAVTFDHWIEIDPRLTTSGRDLSLPLGTQYLQHLRDHGAEIRGLINGLA